MYGEEDNHFFPNILKFADKWNGRIPRLAEGGKKQCTYVGKWFVDQNWVVVSQRENEWGCDLGFLSKKVWTWGSVHKEAIKILTKPFELTSFLFWIENEQEHLISKLLNSILKIYQPTQTQELQNAQKFKPLKANTS